MSDDILKDDPLKKPKKITVGVCVSVLAVATVATFASFHWVCSDYFRFKHTEQDAIKRLERLVASYAEEEAAARSRLAEVAAKSKESESAAIKKAKDAEDTSEAKIAQSEKRAQERIDAIDSEYEAKRKAKEAEYLSRQADLESEMKAKREEFKQSVFGYKTRFDEMTNALEQVVVSRRAELASLKQQVMDLPDLNKQCSDASNACLAARLQRDSAMAKLREAQDEYNKWSDKAGKAQTACDSLGADKTALQGEISKLTSDKNEIEIALAALQGSEKSVAAKIQESNKALEGVKGSIKEEDAQLEGLRAQVKNENAKKSAAEQSRVQAEKARDKARDEEREALTARDAAQEAKKLSDKQLMDSQADNQRLLDAMSKLLKQKSAEVEAKVGSQEEGNK
jgi:chromosome segregation ATPase